MSLLLETLRYEDGVLQHAEWHQDRVNRSRLELLGLNDELHIAGELHLPAAYAQGTVRCRVIYHNRITSVTFEPYTPRILKSIAIVASTRLSYRYKYADRRALNTLVTASGADDILIVMNGLVTDASYANLVFRRGDAWFTPAQPLLAGTCRARLIAGGDLIPAHITPADINNYHTFKLINAMMDLESAPEYPVSIIRGV